jgi:AcrR family transcriptional regulator
MIRGAGAVGEAVQARSRQIRVEATERRILTAAAELFVARGYQDTTLAAVAERAGVGARTVYLRFGSKGAVLLGAVAQAEGAAGDAGDAGGSDRACDPEPRSAVAGYARRCRAEYESLGGLLGVLAQASATEPFVAAAVEGARASRRRAAADLVDGLRRGDPRADGPAPGPLAETVAVLGSAETWLQLTGSAGWHPDDYQAWLAVTIRAVLA